MEFRRADCFSFLAGDGTGDFDCIPGHEIMRRLEHFREFEHSSISAFNCNRRYRLYFPTCSLRLTVVQARTGMTWLKVPKRLSSSTQADPDLQRHESTSKCKSSVDLVGSGYAKDKD